MMTLRHIRPVSGRKPDLLGKKRRGIAAIEFAMIAPVFILFLIGIIEMSLIMLCEHLLESAAYNASRTAKTGFIASGKTQLQTVMDVLNSKLVGLAPLLDVAKVQVTSTVYSDLSNVGQPAQATEGLGTASQIVVYTISYPWKIFTPIISNIIGDSHSLITLTSRIVVRNEPYD